MLGFTLLLLFFLCFPYVTPISFGTDVQPWGLIFSTILLMLILLKGYRVKILLLLLLIPIITSILLFPLSDRPFSAFRSVCGYVSIGVIPIVFHYLLKINYEKTIFILKFATIAYMLVGLIQAFVDINFMSFVLNRLQGGSGRGVNSLSPEPTFYGLICLFLLLTISALEMTHKKIYIFLLLFQIIFLSISSMTILLLVVFGFFFLLFSTSPKNILLGSLGCILIFYVIKISSIDNRAINLATQLFSNPEILLIDGSINSRLAHIVFSLTGFFENYGISNGLAAFQFHYISEMLGHDIFFHQGKVYPSRIMSFYGSILFELGIFGILIPIVYSLIIFEAYKDNVKHFLILMFSINAIMFTAIPMSFSLVGMYFGALIFRAENRARFYNLDT